MIEGFLLGIITTCSLVAGAFFFKFWRRTRDPLFFAFGTAFLIEGLNRISFLFLERPSHVETHDIDAGDIEPDDACGIDRACGQLGVHPIGDVAGGAPGAEIRVAAEHDRLAERRHRFGRQSLL